MGIGTQATRRPRARHGAPKTRGRSEAEREARVWYGYGVCGEWRDRAKWCLGYFYPFKAKMGTFTLLAQVY